MNEEKTQTQPTAEAQQNSAVAVAETNPKTELTSAFGSEYEMSQAWRVSRMLASSSLVPDAFRDKPNDVMIAVDMALRLKMPPFAVLQQLYIVHGKPSFSAQFLISCVNSCGKFTPLMFKTGANGGVIAYAKSRDTGETLESPEVTIEMATAEGWVSKAGSKWKTMPDLMARYRAATFFARLFAPEVAFGIRTTDELADIGGADATESPKFTLGK